MFEDVRIVRPTFVLVAKCYEIWISTHREYIWSRTGNKLAPFTKGNALLSMSSPVQYISQKSMDWKGMFRLRHHRPSINSDLDKRCSACKGDISTSWTRHSTMHLKVGTPWVSVSRLNEYAISLVMASSWTSITFSYLVFIESPQGSMELCNGPCVGYIRLAGCKSHYTQSCDESL